MSKPMIPLRVCGHCHGEGTGYKGRRACRTCHGYGVYADQLLTDREVAIQLQLRIHEARQALWRVANGDQYAHELMQPRIYDRYHRICVECKGQGMVGQGYDQVPCHACRALGVTVGNAPGDALVVLVPMRRYLAQLMAAIEKTCQQKAEQSSQSMEQAANGN